MDDEQAGRVVPTSLSISSLLNNPNAPQAFSVRPGTRDIPLVRLTPLSTASISDFSEYIGQVGNEYDNYLRAKQYGLQQHLRSNQHRPRITAGSIFSGTEGTEARLAEQIPSSIAPSSRVSLDDASSVFSEPQDSPGSELNGFSFGSVNGNQIPAIFSEHDFELKNPRTFDLVTGSSSIVAPISGVGEPKSNPSHGVHLQEKLSNFMDTIESTLVDEISATGPAFFDALEELRDLQTRANSCIDRIDVLRDEFARLSTDNADIRISSVQTIQKKNNIRKLRQSIGLVQNLNQLYQSACCTDEKPAHEIIQALTSFDQFVIQENSLQSLAIVEEMQYNVSKVKHSLGRGDTIKFKKNMMDDLTNQVETCNTEQSIDLLRQRHIRDRKVVLNKLYGSEIAHSTDELRSSLDPILKSLTFTDQVQVAYLEYKEAVIKEAKLITKRSLPINEDDDMQSNISGRTNRTAADKSSALATALRNMAATDFNNMLRDIFSRTCVFVRRVSAHQKLLIDLISSSTQAVPQEAQNLVYSTDLAQMVVDICQTRIVKLLNVRSVINTELSFQDVRRYYELITVFVAECEALTGQYGTNLQSVLVGQIKGTFARYADVATQSLITAIETDTWQPATLASCTQDTVNSILDATIHNPEKWQEPLPNYAVTSETLTGDAKSVVLENTKYVLPLSAAALIACLEIFLSVSQLLPVLRADAVASTIEVLKLYNSRSCQLILGAGATRSAGLERITAKHLAVTSQALAIVSVLIPSIKSYFVRQGCASAAITECDKLYKLYSEHRLEIHGKLISIMEDRTVQICKQLAAWIDSSPEIELTGEPNIYIMSLVKDTLVLARVLTKFLEADALKSILQKVIEIEETKLAAEYARVPEGGNMRAQVDVDKRHFVEKISAVITGTGKILSISKQAD